MTISSGTRSPRPIKLRAARPAGVGWATCRRNKSPLDTWVSSKCAAIGGAARISAWRRFGTWLRLGSQLTLVLLVAYFATFLPDGRGI